MKGATEIGDWIGRGVTVASALDLEGYCLLRGVMSPDRLARVRADLDAAVAGGGSALRRSGGALYAVRNLDAVWPGVIGLVGEGSAGELVRELAGEECGVVRAILFDKPVGRTWSLPWHRDLSVAVEDNTIPLPGEGGSEGFSRPTTKAGVPHLEAPGSLLRRMLTLRFHLDDTDESNGCLRVLPGTHREGKEPRELRGIGTDGTPVIAAAGDVLLMRPLLMHRSLSGREGDGRGRRIIHIEIAPEEELPGGVRWASFRRANPAGGVLDALRPRRHTAPDAA